MRMKIEDLLEQINACGPARRWAKKLGEHAFYKAWHTCPETEWLEYFVYHLQGDCGRLTEEDRRTCRRMDNSIAKYMDEHDLTYPSDVPARVVRSVVSWTYVKKLLRRFSREVRP